MTAFNMAIVHLPFSVNDDTAQQRSSNEYPQSYTDGNYEYNTWSKNTHDLLFDSNDRKQFFLYETRNEIKKHNVFFFWVFSLSQFHRWSFHQNLCHPDKNEFRKYSWIMRNKELWHHNILCLEHQWDLVRFPPWSWKFTTKCLAYWGAVTEPIYDTLLLVPADLRHLMATTWDIYFCK